MSRMGGLLRMIKAFTHWWPTLWRMTGLERQIGRCDQNRPRARVASI
jgi:hypothetical protein